MFEKQGTVYNPEAYYDHLYFKIRADFKGGEAFILNGENGGGDIEFNYIGEDIHSKDKAPCYIAGMFRAREFAQHLARISGQVVEVYEDNTDELDYVAHPTDWDDAKQLEMLMNEYARCINQMGNWRGKKRPKNFQYKSEVLTMRQWVKYRDARCKAYEEALPRVLELIKPLIEAHAAKTGFKQAILCYRAGLQYWDCKRYDLAEQPQSGGIFFWVKDYSRGGIDTTQFDSLHPAISRYMLTYVSEAGEFRKK